METIRSLALFILAGPCEIGGGYLMWLWLKEGKPLWYGLVGTLILDGYPIIVDYSVSPYCKTIGR